MFNMYSVFGVCVLCASSSNEILISNQHDVVQFNETYKQNFPLQLNIYNEKQPMNCYYYINDEQ